MTTVSHLTHPHHTGRARARRRYATPGRRAQVEQLATLLFFALVVLGFSLASAGPLLR